MVNGASALGVEVEELLRPRMLFTAPWEPPLVRRGDALGLRALTDVFAETVAPGLSNRVQDGRWVTILAWSLARSQDVFHASGGHSVETRGAQADRYAWLRPLELMWVARTVALAEDWRERALAGRRRVAPWCEAYQDGGHAPDRFGMTSDQFRAYRQTGIYGAYRVAFRKWPGMTSGGNGWTPGKETNRLADWLDARLGKAKPSWPLHASHGDDGLSTRSAKRRRGDECQWWLQHWDNFTEGSRAADENTLPRRRDDHDVLPEVDLLKAIVFGTDPGGQRRRQVALEIGRSSARDHIGVCEHLSRAFPGERAIALLPAFSRLADAGIAAMDHIAAALRGKTSIALEDVVSKPAARAICDELQDAAAAWRSGANLQIRHIETAHRFAAAVQDGRPHECLRALLQYHELHGGGVRWFVLRSGRVEVRMRPSGAASRYGFRLYSLCRLANQCGVLRKMPAGVLREEEAIGVEE
jgi:hypothetical protein